MKKLSGAALKNSKYLAKLATLRNTLPRDFCNWAPGSAVKIHPNRLLDAKPISMTIDENGWPVNVVVKITRDEGTVRCEYSIVRGRLSATAKYI